MTWPTVSLGEVAQIDRTSIQPAAISSGTAYLGLENISSGGDFVSAQIVDSGDLGSSKFKFTPDHVLYGKLRPYLAKIVITDFSGICSTDIIPILPSKKLDKRYLLRFLRQPHIVDLANSRSAGANLPRLSPSELAKFRLPLPPLSEQRRIAAILDHADALRMKRRTALTQLGELAQSIFLEMFGDPATNPRHLPKVALVELCRSKSDIKCGPFGTQLKASEFVDQGVPLWGIRNVNAFFQRPTNEYVDQETAKKLSQYSIIPGDIVMTRKGTIGNSAVYPKGWPSGIMHSDLLRLRIDPAKATSEYLSHQLHHSRDIEHQLMLIGGGAVMPGINVSRLKTIEVIAPPLSEQQIFTSHLESIDVLRSQSSSVLAELDGLFASLQSRAFRGEL